jgi:hypothetical protein
MEMIGIPHSPLLFTLSPLSAIFNLKFKVRETGENGIIHPEMRRQ